MPGLVVTRGLGGSPSSLIVIGFSIGEAARRVIAGATRFAKKAVAELEESFKISVMLLSINGKELTNPIVSSIARTFKDDELVVDVIPKKLIARKSYDLSVEAKLSNGENNDESD